MTNHLMKQPMRNWQFREATLEKQQAQNAMMEEYSGQLEIQHAGY